MLKLVTLSCGLYFKESKRDSRTTDLLQYMRKSVSHTLHSQDNFLWLHCILVHWGIFCCWYCMSNWLIVVDHWCMMDILDFEEFSTKPECKLDSAVSSCVYLHNYSHLSPQLCVIIIVSHRQPIHCPSLPAVLLLPAMNVYIHACIGSLQPAPMLHLTMPKPWAQNRIQPHFMPHEAINLHQRGLYICDRLRE